MTSLLKDYLNTTDAIVLVLFLFFFWSGWRKGLLRSILGPLSLLLCSVAGIVYYDVSGNMFKAATIALAGSFILAFVIRILLFMGRATADKQYRDQTFIVSRILGGLLNLAWKGTIVLAVIFFTTLVPLNLPTLKTIKDDINSSKTLAYLNLYALSKTGKVRDAMKVFDVLKDPSKFETVTATKEYRAFATNPKVKEAFSDQDVVKLVEDRNVSQLLTHPKIKDLLRDEEVMKDFSDLVKKIYSTR